MVKAKYVAEDYMKSSNLLTDEEITHVLNKYEEINKNRTDSDGKEFHPSGNSC